MVGVAGRFYKSCEVRIATTRTKTLLPRTFQKAVTLEFHVILLFLLPAISMAQLVLNQKYKLASSENFEEFMKALDVGLVTRKVGAAVSPVIELTEKDGVYTLSSTSTFKDSVISFRLGEEFDEETPDGRHVKSIITQEGNKLIHIQKGKKDTKIIREFTPEEVKMTLTVDDIVCTRVYKKLE